MSVMAWEKDAVLGKSRLNQRLNIPFQKKAALKPVSAGSVQIHNQLRLVAGTLDLFHWKERKVVQLQRRYQQFTKSMGLLVSFSKTKGENSTVLSINCARSLE